MANFGSFLMARFSLRAIVVESLRFGSQVIMWLSVTSVPGLREYENYKKRSAHTKEQTHMSSNGYKTALARENIGSNPVVCSGFDSKLPWHGV